MLPARVEHCPLAATASGRARLTGLTTLSAADRMIKGGGYMSIDRRC